MESRSELSQMRARAAKFEAYLERKRIARLGEDTEAEKRFIRKVLERQEAKRQGEDIVCEGLLAAYDTLDQRRKQALESLGLSIPGYFEFDEWEIRAMYSELRHTEETEEVPFLPKGISDRAFDQLVESGLLIPTKMPEYNEGERTGHYINGYRRP